MIATAKKYVNARLGFPRTDSPNPFFLNPGDQVNVQKRFLGEIYEGSNEWFFTDKNEFYTSVGFTDIPEVSSLAFENVPSLFSRLKINELWDFCKSKGENIPIGIVDHQGVAAYRAIKNKVSPLNYDIESMGSDNHSTCMASIIGAEKYEKKEVGIAPGVSKIYSYKIDDESLKPGDLLQCLKALKKCGAKVINMSISSTVFLADDYKEVSTFLKELKEENILLLSSTGNRPIRKKSYPAALDGVISVAGYVANDNTIDANSNVWNGVNICAPYNRYFDDTFLAYKGTSNSCAMLSGIMACSYNKLLQVKGNKNLYDFLTQNLFPVLSKLMADQANNITLPFYNTSEFINLLK